MIATLINHDDLEESWLVVILQPDNLKRMRKGDPATLETKGLAGGILEPAKYPKLRVLVAYEEDEFILNKMALAGDVEGIMCHVTRGFKFSREQGDGGENAFKINRKPEGS